MSTSAYFQQTSRNDLFVVDRAWSDTEEPRQDPAFLPTSMSASGTSLMTKRLSYLARRLERRSHSSEGEIQKFDVTLSETFKVGIEEYPRISIDSNVLQGAPCIRGTRIPVYMVLDDVESGGSLESAIESYPRLVMEDVRAAVGFAKLIVECPIEYKTPAASR